MTSVCFVNHRKEKGSEGKSCPWVVVLPCYLKQGLLTMFQNTPLSLVCTVLFNCQMPITDGSNACPLAICFRSLAYKSAEAEIICSYCSSTQHGMMSPLNQQVYFNYFIWFERWLSDYFWVMHRGPVIAGVSGWWVWVCEGCRVWVAKSQEGHVFTDTDVVWIVSWNFLQYANTSTFMLIKSANSIMNFSAKYFQHTVWQYSLE